MSRLISRKATLYAPSGLPEVGVCIIYTQRRIIPYFTRMPGYSPCVL